MSKEGAHLGRDPRSAESLDREIEELLLSGERVGEGGKAVIVRLSSDRIPPELRPAFEFLSEGSDPEEGHASEDVPRRQAVKLFKLYLPNKGKNEYEMQGMAYDLLQKVPEAEREAEYAAVPRLSSSHEVVFDKEMKHKLEERFSLPPLGERSQLIAMEYVDGEDLATVFYKWILEREGLISEHADEMDFTQLYDEVAGALHLEVLPMEDIDAPQDVMELAEWKTSAKNAEKIYAYLRKHKFPMPPEVASRVERTLTLMHGAHMTHGDAFERNIMITGGSRALREKGTLQGEKTYLIDFGETRNRFVPEVDDFNVVRRLKTLSVSREEERKREDEARLGDISAKAELLRANDRWQGIYAQTKNLRDSGSTADRERALMHAWNNTASAREEGMEDFFIVLKDLIDAGAIQREEADIFIRERRKGKMTPYAKNILGRCEKWLNASG